LSGCCCRRCHAGLLLRAAAAVVPACRNRGSCHCCATHTCVLACLPEFLQLSFRALFTIAANCQLLEVGHMRGREAAAVAARALFYRASGARQCWLGRRAQATLAEPRGCLLPGIPSRLQDVCISEEGLEEPVVDDDCIICLAQVGAACLLVCAAVWHAFALSECSSNLAHAGAPL
jgi:hypothetical protein